MIIRIHGEPHTFLGAPCPLPDCPDPDTHDKEHEDCIAAHTEVDVIGPHPTHGLEWKQTFTCPHETHTIVWNALTPSDHPVPECRGGQTTVVRRAWYGRKRAVVRTTPPCETMVAGPEEPA